MLKKPIRIGRYDALISMVHHRNQKYDDEKRFVSFANFEQLDHFLTSSVDSHIWYSRLSFFKIYNYIFTFPINYKLGDSSPKLLAAVAR